MAERHTHRYHQTDATVLYKQSTRAGCYGVYSLLYRHLHASGVMQKNNTVGV